MDLGKATNTIGKIEKDLEQQHNGKKNNDSLPSNKNFRKYTAKFESQNPDLA